MKSHEFPAPENGSKGQQRCAPEPLMQVHEKRYMKCAGVAGLRERARTFSQHGCADSSFDHLDRFLDG